MAVNSGMSQDQLNYLVGQARKVRQDLATTGTVNSKTPTQNLAAVANQPGNTSGAVATPYIMPDGTTDYRITGGSYTPDKTTQLNIDGDTGKTLAGGNGGILGAQQQQDTGMGNAQDYINQINDLRKNAAISALGKSRDLALSGLGAEKSAIQPKYYEQRNQLASGAQQQARNFQEYMASRGGASSGAAAQGELMRNVSTQGGLGALGQQEAAAYTDIGRRTSDIQSGYASDIASATAGAESDKMKMLYDEYVRAQQRGDTQKQYDIQNAMAQSQANMKQQEQTFTQNLNLQKQTFTQNLDVQKQHIDLANKLTELFGVKVNPTSDPMQAYAQVAGLSTTAAQKIAQDTKQSTFDNAIKLALANNTISVSQANILNQVNQLAISQQNANTSSASEGTRAGTAQQNQLMDIWKATGQAPAGIQGVQEGTPYAGQTSVADNKLKTAEGYANYTDGVAKYAVNQQTGIKTLSNPVDVESSILQSNLPESEMKKLYTRYGLKWGG